MTRIVLAAIALVSVLALVLALTARGDRGVVASQSPVYRSRYFFPPSLAVRRVRDLEVSLDRPVRVLAYMQFDTRKGYERYTVAINRQYCATHGHSFVLVDADKYADVPPYWRKVFILRDLLRDDDLCRDIDYVMWLDSDAAFVGPPIERMLHPDASLVVHVGMDSGVARSARFGVENRWANAGVFLVKCGEAGRAFADTWARAYDPDSWCRRGRNLGDLTCRRREAQWASRLGVPPDPAPVSAWSTASRWSWDNYEQNMMTATMRRPEFVRVSCAYEWDFMSRPDPARALFVLHMYGRGTAARTAVFRARFALMSNARAPMDAFTS